MMPRILVFDSGMGGLTVASAIRAELPQAELVYAADSAAPSPMARGAEPLVERIAAVVAADRRDRADAVVIACNTASTLALAELRSRHAALHRHRAGDQAGGGADEEPHHRGAGHPRHGHPRIHPGADPHLCLSLPGHSAWCAASRRDGGGAACRGAPDLAAIAGEIAPVFREIDGERTDVVVLGCTRTRCCSPSSRRRHPGR